MTRCFSFSNLFHAFHFIFLSDLSQRGERTPVFYFRRTGLPPPGIFSDKKKHNENCCVSINEK